MYCRRCSYALKGSIARYPECGGAFDPADPDSFRRISAESLGRIVMRALVMFLVIALPCFAIGLLLFPPRPPAVSWLELARSSAAFAIVTAFTVGVPGLTAYLVLRPR